MRKHRLLSGPLFANLLGFTILSLSAAAQTTAPNEWTWMGGSSTIPSCSATICGQPGVYGTQGTPDLGNIPGGRRGAVSWTDSDGNFWLYGGSGYDDLWEFNISTNEWAWMGGSNTSNQPAVYGTMGTAAAGNTPGSRGSAVSWADKSGNFWLFGGEDLYLQPYVNNFPPNTYGDLWKFIPPPRNQWVWMGGNGIPTGTTPGGRIDATSWTDSSGNFWLFGGYLIDADGLGDYYNDLWKLNPSANQWALISGSGFSIDQPGVYGTLGVPAAGNNPGGRSGAAGWADKDGNLWLFGGPGYDAKGNFDNLNDLWEFNSSANQWIWMGGSNTFSNHTVDSNGVYGTLGTPATGNIPGSRSDAASWTDSSGNFWLFGGNGLDSNGTFGSLNDLWEFNPAANAWVWMGGSSTVGSHGGQPGLYGTLGKPAAGNLPGGRWGDVSWIDSNGNLWLFGGLGTDANGNGGALNDLWQYQPVSAVFQVTIAPVLSLVAGTYATTQTVTISDATPNATIYFTTDGNLPTTTSTIYSGPIIVSVTETLNAIAKAGGYVNSAIASATYTIPPDFNVAINPTSLSVQSGQSVTATITVQDEGGFNGNISFACSGLPAGAACSFSPLTVPTPAGISYTTLTVAPAATTAAVRSNGHPLFPAAALAAALCCFGWKKRRCLQLLVLLAVAVVGLGLLNGCTSTSSPQPITTTITVTAASGSLSHATTFTLTVN